jgi:hypothetical protein
MSARIILSITTAALFSIVSAQNPISESGKTIPTASFKKTDLGNPSIPGKIITSREGLDITAGGADIWGTKDEGTFAYVERSGDFDFISRIESVGAAHQYTKAGIMAREDLDAGSRHIYFQVFPDNRPRNKNNGGFEFQYRLEKDKEMKAIYPERFEGTPDFPVTYPNTWIRLKRQGNEFTGLCSNDGKTWKAFTSFSLNLPSKVFLGLAVTSHDAGKTTLAKFRDIKEN